MKTQIVFTSDNAEQKVIGKDFENEVKKAMYLALKEKGLLTQYQYDECIERMK